MTSEEAKERVVACAVEIAASAFEGASPLRVVLFGSRARGDFDDRSDFDIGIDAGGALSASVLARIRDSFDALNILQRVDVVDLAAVRPEFRALAAQHEEVIFER